MRLWRVAGIQVGRPGNEGAKSPFTLVYFTTHAGRENSFEEQPRHMQKKNVALSTSRRVKLKKKCKTNKGGRW